MARDVTSRKDRTCGWCLESIPSGETMRWHMKIGGIVPVHPLCEDPAFRKDRDEYLAKKNKEAA